MISFFTGRFGSDTVSPLFPGKHRFTNMNPPIIYDIGLHDFISVCFQDFRNAVAQ